MAGETVFAYADKGLNYHQLFIQPNVTRSSEGTYSGSFRFNISLEKVPIFLDPDKKTRILSDQW